MLDPEGSWAAKWTAVARGITGIYAVKVYGDVPDELEELCGALPCKILIDMESDREQMKREAGY